MSAEIKTLDVDNIVKLYRSGVPEYSIAKMMNVDRGTIRKRLIRKKIRIRNNSSASILRYKKMTFAEKQSLTKNANKAWKGTKMTDEQIHKSSISKQKSLFYVGKGEKEIFDWMTKKGIKCIQQFAINRYNIDIAAFPIAVEVCFRSSNPLFQKNDREKIKYLVNHGWSVLYIHIKPPAYIIEAHADYAVSFFNEVCADKSLLGEYRVIGRNSELKARMRFD